MGDCALDYLESLAPWIVSRPPRGFSISPQDCGTRGAVQNADGHPRVTKRLQGLAAFWCVLAGVALLLLGMPATADDSPYAKSAEQTDEKTQGGDETARPAKKRRGGINPCMTPDPGFGIY